MGVITTQVITQNTPVLMFTMAINSKLANICNFTHDLKVTQQMLVSVLQFS